MGRMKGVVSGVRNAWVGVGQERRVPRWESPQARENPTHR